MERPDALAQQRPLGHDITSDGTFRRVLNEPYAEELRRSQKRVADTLARLKRLAPVD